MLSVLHVLYTFFSERMSTACICTLETRYFCLSSHLNSELEILFTKLPLAWVKSFFASSLLPGHTEL